MAQSENPITAAEHSGAEKPVRPILALEMADVSNLDTVLRGYYLSQIKSLEKRKDRKLARQLLEDHLVLPKSRQRTSKDAAYIKEVLGIDHALLERLEESRLIRGIRKTGANPIYEISHDTLVEPILAERRNREVITRFIKRTWKYIVILLLLWFLLGMWFENRFEVLPTPAQEPKSIDIVMEEQVIGLGENPTSLLLPLPPIIIDQELRPADSILIKLPIEPFRLANLRSDAEADSDTISIRMDTPIEVPVDAADLPVTYQTFSNVVVPLAYTNSDPGDPDARRLYAKLSGNLKMTAKGGEAARPREYDSQLAPIEIQLGDTLVQAEKSARSVPVNFSLRLTDFFEDENDKNSVRNLLGDRPVKLSYTVQVGAAPVPPAPKQAELPSVQGIEVQYSDGTKKFIAGDTAPGANEAERIHIVAQGETLFSIARKYGIVDENGKTSIEAIKQLNGLRNNTISVGQALRIPGN